jgi:hypothetical protein
LAVASSPRSELIELLAMGTPAVYSSTLPDAATTVVAIEHRSASLAATLLSLSSRRIRLMAWTHDQVTGFPRNARSQWTRITIDDLVHVTARTTPAGWTSNLVSELLQPLIDLCDAAMTNPGVAPAVRLTVLTRVSPYC